jgi:hypothetical protein
VFDSKVYCRDCRDRLVDSNDGRGLACSGFCERYRRPHARVRSFERGATEGAKRPSWSRGSKRSERTAP